MGPSILQTKLDYHPNATVDVADTALIRNSEITVASGAEFIVKPRAIIDQCKLYVLEGAILEIGEKTRLDGIKARVRKPRATLKIGNNCIINLNSLIICDCLIEIGNYVLIAQNVFLTDSQVHSLNWRERRKEIDQLNLGQWPDLNAKTSKLKIQNDCWLGRSSQVLKPKGDSEELILARGTIVGAGSIVNESSPEFFKTMAGVPAKFIRHVESDSYEPYV
ncbi:MAG: acyltransferase [Oscillatoria sp. SIO1A7]|nr:acyltransferase [Oscillatoria sp. SIO1A7]